MTKPNIVAVGLCDADLQRLAELAAEINCYHLACEKAASESLAHAMRAGDLLAAAKKHCPHGTWQTWLSDNFKGSDRTARNYMRLANNREAIGAETADSAVLSIDAALQMLATPKEEATEDPARYLPGCLVPLPGGCVVQCLKDGLQIVLPRGNAGVRLGVVAAEFFGEISREEWIVLGECMIHVSIWIQTQPTKNGGTAPTHERLVLLKGLGEFQTVLSALKSSGCAQTAEQN